ncbi:MAG: DUF2461 domain-containing protein [Ignavibacteriaceae bacterium]
MKKQLPFPQNTAAYLSSLSKNNNKEWFEKHRHRYNDEFIQPAVQFVIDLGEKLSTISPDVNYIPKIDKSIFRLYRDIRFSKNKSPFKTNLGLYFWEGTGKKMECSGYYFHLEPKYYFLGAGMYEFTKDHIKVFRDKVADINNGKELNDIIKKILKNKNYKLGGKTFKRIPKGYDPEYKYSDLLLHSGLYIYYENNNLSELISNDPAEYCFKIFKDLRPLHKWLVENVK